MKAERFAWEFCRYLTSDHKIQLVTILPTFVIGPLLPIHAFKDEKERDVTCSPSSTMGGIPILSVLKQAALEHDEEFLNKEKEAMFENILSNMLTELTQTHESVERVRRAFLSGSIQEIYRLLILHEETPSIFNSLNVGFVDVRDVARCHLLALETKQAKGNRFICCNATLPFIDTLQKIATEMIETFHLRHVNSNLNVEFEPSVENITPMKKIDGSKAEKILGLKYTPLDQTIREMIQSFIDWKLVTVSRRGSECVVEKEAFSSSTEEQKMEPMGPSISSSSSSSAASVGGLETLELNKQKQLATTTTATPPPSPQTNVVATTTSEISSASPLPTEQDQNDHIIAAQEEKAPQEGISQESTPSKSSLEEQKEKFTVIAETLYP